MFNFFMKNIYGLIVVLSICSITTLINMIFEMFFILINGHNIFFFKNFSLLSMYHKQNPQMDLKKYSNQVLCTKYKCNIYALRGQILSVNKVFDKTEKRCNGTDKQHLINAIINGSAEIIEGNNRYDVLIFINNERHHFVLRKHSTRKILINSLNFNCEII